MKRLFFIFCLLAIAPWAQAQLIDPILSELLDAEYIRINQTNAISALILKDGTITAEKLNAGFALSPNQITGTALVQTNLFNGPNISGPFNGLVITGFYSSSNPSNFTTLAEVNAQGFATETFVLTQGFLTNEVDPEVTGFSMTTTWHSVTSDGLGVITNVQVYLKGLLKTWTTNGVPWTP